MEVQESGLGERRPRVIFFGMECDFSLPALLSLFEHDIEVCAVVVPSSMRSLPSALNVPAIQLKEPHHTLRGSLPMMDTNTTSPSIVQVARQRSIPVWEVRKLAAILTLDVLSAYQPDFICVACFPAIIPSTILAIPSLGCVNVHPSLLPVNRGPLPVFWTLHEGHQTTGVTIHFMTSKLDSGDILAQGVIPVPEGIRYAQLEEQCAQLGGQLLVRVMWNIFRGQAVSIPQDETKSSYYPNPSDADYVVTTREWDARRLYNFIRGVASEDEPIELITGDRCLLAVDAISYSLRGYAASLNMDQDNKPDCKQEGARVDSAYEYSGASEYSVQMVPCQDGWVRALCREILS